MMDQRRAARLPVDLPARTCSADAALEGRATNISQDGIYFRATNSDSELAKLAVEIDLPDTEAPLSLTGEVRWVDDEAPEAGMGIRFTHISPRERLLLANFVLRRSQR